jgi:thiamine biosynthesis lipoprotein
VTILHSLAAGAALLATLGADGVVERHVYVMGTRASLAVWEDSRSAGLFVLESAVDALERTERQLSTWRDDSVLSALNRTPSGTPFQLSLDLCSLFGAISDWHRVTDGAFDPSIGELLEAWDVTGSGRIPTATELERGRSSSGMRHFDLDLAQCRVTRIGAARIDAGAFGKGVALDRAAAVLSGRRWMIDLGGQVSVGRQYVDGLGWPVAVADPLRRDRPALNLLLREGSLATSGGSERDLMVAGQRVGHIIDPRSGSPADFTGSVSVWHQSALVADVLSTAMFVMGPDEGLRWAEAAGIAACFLESSVAGEIRVRMTSSFGALVVG